MEYAVKPYDAPRITYEIADCGMPVTMDTYSKCSYNCLYCFSWYQKSIDNKTHGESDYQKKELKAVEVRRIESLMKGEISNKFYKDYVANRKVIQWGGLADQFDNYERKEGRTLELLKVFKKYNYPLSFSTKGTWWLYDERYLELFRGQDNWNVKFSIINLDPKISALIEKGVDSPQKRIEAIRIYSKLNQGGATLRLRPFIIGMSNRNNEHLELIKQAREAGATAVSTEFFCLERRAMSGTLQRYKWISDAIGFDIVKFYTEASDECGYLRLRRSIKIPYIRAMKELCDKLGLRFYVSDSGCKDFSHNGCCCGLPESWNYERQQFTNAMMIAKEKGEVHFKDVFTDEYTQHNFVKMSIVKADSVERVKWGRLTLLDWFRRKWNDVKHPGSMYVYFRGILRPKEVDSDGNIIYTYHGVDKNGKEALEAVHKKAVS